MFFTSEPSVDPAPPAVSVEDVAQLQSAVAQRWRGEIDAGLDKVKAGAAKAQVVAIDLLAKIQTPYQAFLAVDSAQHLVAGVIHMRHFVVGRGAQTKGAIRRMRHALEDAGADPSTVSRLERPGGMRVDVVHFFYASSHFLVSFLSGVAAFDPLLCENTHLQRLMVKGAMWWHLCSSAASSGIVERNDGAWGIHLLMGAGAAMVLYMTRKP